MRFEMYAEVGVAGKTFTARMTRVASVRAVLLLVVAHFAALRKTLAAHRAGVAALAGVPRLVDFLLGARFAEFGTVATAEVFGGREVGPSVGFVEGPIAKDNVTVFALWENNTYTLGNYNQIDKIQIGIIKHQVSIYKPEMMKFHDRYCVPVFSKVEEMSLFWSAPTLGYTVACIHSSKFNIFCNLILYKNKKSKLEM